MIVRVRRYVMDRAGDPPAASVVIPTLQGHRNGRLNLLRRSLRRQHFQDFEVIEVCGDCRQGRAINRAVRLSRGAVIITLDDDSQLHDRSTFGRLVTALKEDPRVGIAGTSTVPGPGSSAFQRLAVRQIPRRYFPILYRTRDSDMAQHPCMAIRRSVFESVGGEDEELVRGLDPLLRHKVRRAGYRVVVVAGAWISHPVPEGIAAVARQYFRNGRGSAFAQLRYPGRVCELSDGMRENRFAPQRSLWFRMLRFTFRLYRSCLSLEVVGLVAGLAYLAGYGAELLAAWKTRNGTAPPGSG